MKKLIDFKDGKAVRIQEFANRTCNGNFTTAIDILIEQSLKRHDEFVEFHKLNGLNIKFNGE